MTACGSGPAVGSPAGIAHRVTSTRIGGEKRESASPSLNGDEHKWLEAHPEFRLEPLPPYSPNLNLIERLWRFLRGKALKVCTCLPSLKPGPSGVR